MSFRDLLMFRGDYPFDSVIFYLVLCISVTICVGIYLHVVIIDPEIKSFMETIPVMDCKELGNKILNNEIIYSEPMKLAEKHWQIRCHGGLAP